MTTTENYFKQWQIDQKKVDVGFLNARLFSTIDRFLRVASGRPLAGRLLDIGCGDGSFVGYSVGRGLSARGVDIGDGVNFESDVLPFEADSFDIATMFSVIEHLRDPANILSEARRVLASGGVLVIITPNLDTTGSRFWDDPTHVHPYNPRSLTRLMEMSGFETVSLGLWSVGKTSLLWRLPVPLQFFIGRSLPFAGLNKYAPWFLKGRSTTMLGAFRVRK
ncbi:MAG: Methyltransferase type 11 [Parcubacteria group bacterium GW2011_GWA2_56_21]|nr:MAG: Methyltransferase type 11 [Parcubacteria group bacterium GW2011_GWA2_56_21]